MPKDADITVLTDLGYGDQGKGTVTHYLTAQLHAHTVIRSGGPQAYHTVVTADGRVHTHRQIGSGALAGAKTFLSERMVIEPYALIQEGKALEELGVSQPYADIVLDENAICVTPFHRIANRLKELARGSQRHGTVGLGVGEAIQDAKALQPDTVRAKDIGTPWLSQKLISIRQRKLAELASILTQSATLPEAAQTEIAQLNNPSVIDWATQWFNHLGSLVEIVPSSYLEVILSQEGPIICEPSQGALLDPWYGFYPHVTQGETVPQGILDLLYRHGVAPELVQKVGIVRAYQTRHGAGPFVTEDPEWSQRFADPHNPDQEWQGNFRVGPFDLLATRYALAACGGAESFHGLAVTCLDQMVGTKEWPVCTSYSLKGEPPSNLDSFFEHTGDRLTQIKLPPADLPNHYQRQEELGQLLRRCQPHYTFLPADQPEALLCFLEQQLGVPVILTSHGPSAATKRLRSQAVLTSR